MRYLPLFFAISMSGHASDALNLTLGAPYPFRISSTPSFTNSAIDGPAKKIEYVWQAKTPSAISSFLIRYGARAGTPPEYKLSVQEVSTSTGNADGTVIVATSFTPPADTTWDGTVQAISVSFTPAGVGHVYAVVIEPCDGVSPCSTIATPDASNNSSFTMTISSLGNDLTGFPYSNTYSGSWGTKSTGTPVFSYRTSSKSYGRAPKSFTSTLISQGSSQGVAFTVPATWFGNYTVAGVRIAGNVPAASKSYVVSLTTCAAPGTNLQSITMDSDQMTAPSANKITEIIFSGTLATLTTGTKYCLDFSPVESSANFSVITVDLAAAGDRDGFPGGNIFSSITRSSCGGTCSSTSTAYAEDTTKRPMVELILGDITGGSGPISVGHVF